MADFDLNELFGDLITGAASMFAPAPATPAAPVTNNYTQPPATPAKDNTLTYAMIGGGVLVVVLIVVLILKRRK